MVAQGLGENWDMYVTVREQQKLEKPEVSGKVL